MGQSWWPSRCHFWRGCEAWHLYPQERNELKGTCFNRC
jgi:hypothetical protein